MSNTDPIAFALAVVCMCIPFVVAGIMSLTMFLVFYQRARSFDKFFEPMGLTGSIFTFTGRQYRGVVNGRQVCIKLFRSLGLHFEVRTSLQTRFAIGSRTALAQAASGFLGRKLIPLNDPDLGHLAASASDANWAYTLLADPTAKEAILRLTHCEAPFEWRNLTIHPGEALLQLYRFRRSILTPETARAWMDDLLAFITVAEHLPAPGGVQGA